MRVNLDSQPIVKVYIMITIIMLVNANTWSSYILQSSPVSKPELAYINGWIGIDYSKVWNSNYD